VLTSTHATCARIAFLGTILLGMPMARAVTFVVDTVEDRLDDDIADLVCHTSANTCSLRAAIMQANHLPASTTAISIRIPAGTFVLTRPAVETADEETGDLNLATPSNPNQRIDIIGAGAANTVIDANRLDRVFHVETGRSAQIHALTIRNGYVAPGPNSLGLGVLNEGSLTIGRCVIEANTGTNNAGGGIYNTATGVLQVVDSTIRSNVASYGGGMSLYGTTTIRNSTLHDNGSGVGGAIQVWSGNLAQPTVLRIINSTLSDNWANLNGGGIFVVNLGDAGNSRVFLYNASLVGNDADHDHDEIGGTGGGVYVTPGTRFVVVNTLIAGNTQLDGNAADNCFGTLEAYGYNLLDDLTNCAFSGSGILGRGLVAPNTIGGLQANGGPTPTRALLSGSQAIDATNNQGCIDETGARLTVDQRGAPRGTGLDCDVGAFEYGALVPADDEIFGDGFD
jgi:hypothetical protein